VFLILSDRNAAMPMPISNGSNVEVVTSVQRRMGDVLGKLIASHAVALGVTPVTNNEADSVNHAGLPVENWVSNH
jgi:hypothetical protein